MDGGEPAGFSIRVNECGSLDAVAPLPVNREGITKRQNLVITKENEPTVTIENIEVAQFIYLMLDNRKLRSSTPSHRRR